MIIIVELMEMTTSLTFTLILIYDDYNFCGYENVFRTKMTMSMVTDPSDWKLASS